MRKFESFVDQKETEQKENSILTFWMGVGAGIILLALFLAITGKLPLF